MTLFYGIYTFLSLSKDDLSQTCHLINKGVSILAPHDMGSFIHLGFKYVAHISVQTCQRPLNEGLSHVCLPRFDVRLAANCQRYQKVFL